ncbi:hypothetical protein AX17_004721 [Amanita inopinata Kibby_2008]|nr:hypothetical protein AX17_004721 [Amanita inopinata Kibby_2008]
MFGFFSKDKFNPAEDLVDLKGKVIIVTGGNKGIGFATVQYLARAGAKVYLAARDEKRATDAIQTLKSEGLAPGNGEVIWHKLDLSDPRDVKKSAEEFLKLESRLDILINNAALISAPFEKTSDGVSVVVTVNHIGPFVFTRTLLPLLTETARQPGSDVRIINLSSTMYRLISPKVTFNNVEGFNVVYKGTLAPGLYRYAHSKLMTLLWTRSLQKRLDGLSPPAPITVIAIHPGGVNTFPENWYFPTLSKWFMSFVLDTPERGAYTSVFAAASKQVANDREKYKGKYLEHKPTGTIVPLNKGAMNDQLGADLWKTTEDFLQSIGV